MNNLWKSFRLAHILALIPFAVILMGTARLSDATLAPVSFVGLIVLYGLVVVLAGQINDGLRTGYIALVAQVGWLVGGIEISLILVVLGSVIGVMIHQLYISHDKSSRKIPEILGRIAITGNGMLITHAVYSIFGKTLPLATVNLPVLVELMIAILAGYATMQVIGVLVSDILLPQQIQNIWQRLILDSMLMSVAIVLALIHEKIGSMAFVIMLGLAGAQALRHKQVRINEQMLLRQLRDLSLLNNLSRQISAHLELDEVLVSIYEEIRQLVQVTSVYVALYDEDHQMLRFPRVYHNDAYLEWPPRPLGAAVVDYAIRTRQAVAVTTKDGERLRSLGIDGTLLDAIFYAVVPLQIGDKLLGAMVIARNSNGEAFADHDIDLLRTIANQASLVLRNATLYQRTVDLARDLSLINQSLQDVMFNLDRDDAMRTACKIAIQVTEAQKAAIFLLQPNRDNRLELVQSVGFDNQPPVNYLPYTPGLFQSGARIITNINHSNETDLKQHAEQGRFNALVQVPLRSGNTLIGCLTVYHDEPHFYETPELNLLSMLANQITAALDNADLLQALELYAAEQAQLVHLSRISSSNLDLERIIRDVCDMLSQMMDMPQIEIGLHYPEVDVMRVFKSLDSGEPLRIVEFAPGAVPEFDAVLNADTPNPIRLYYEDEPTYSDAFQRYMQQREFHTAALIPMRINQQGIGIIVMGDTVHRIFNDNDYRLLEMATHQISAQLHNARIYMMTEEALIQRLEQLSLIEEIAQQISQALDLDVLIDNVLEAAMQATQAELVALALRTPVRDSEFNVILQEASGGEIRRRTVTLDVTQGVIGQVARTGRTLLVGDNHALDIYFPPPGALHDYRSSLAAPLLKGEYIIGVLHVESSQLNFFTSEQTSFIRSLAGHAAISLTNANLLDEREYQINTLSHLRDLSLETLSMVEQRQMARAILRTALVMLDAHTSALFAHQIPDNTLTMIDGATRSDTTIIHEKPAIPFSLIHAAVEQKVVQTVENTETDAHYQDFTDPVTYRSALVVPIWRRHAVQEVLFVGFKDLHPLQLRDLDTLDLLAVQAASHLENVALNEAIRNGNVRMRAILDSTRDGMILLDQGGHVQDANITAKALLGLPMQGYMGKEFGEVIRKYNPGESSLHALVEAYEEDPDSLNEQEYFLQIGHETRTIKTLITAVTESERDMVGRLLVLRDISEEKSLQQFREKIQSMIFHDLRGPLSSIISNMYLAVGTAEIPDEQPIDELLPTLKATLDSANNLLKLVDTLHDLPSLSQIEIEPERIPVKALVDSACTTLAGILDEAHIEVNYDFASDIDDVYVDNNLIRRVFINLLHNAYKFTPEDGRILITATKEPRENHFIQVSISDTGPGIPTDQRERIFGEFVQLEGQKTRSGIKGMGLGLNFCKLAIEAHGGHIWVAPDGPLPGANFVFTLPYETMRSTIPAQE